VNNTEAFAGLSPLRGTAEHPTTQMKDVNRAVPAEGKAVYYVELLSHPAKCADLNNAPLSRRINLSVFHKETQARAYASLLQRADGLRETRVTD